MISDRGPNRVLTREERQELVLDLYFKENKKQAHKSLAVQAYELFSKGKTLLQVTIDLNLGQAQATAYYEEYLKLVGLGDITKLYIEECEGE
jgi:hypothetical protein